MILDYTKTFIAKLNGISHSRNSYETFNDFIYMASAALYSWKKDEQVEKEYLNIAQNYSAGELEKISELLGILTEAFERTEHGDFLGHIFMTINHNDKRFGQFFTPFNVSSMMAEMLIGKLPTDHVCKISDPCCGTGGMLIACSMAMEKAGYNYQRDAFFVGQDIDHRCAHITFIQLSLMGVPALIICGDTLLMKTYWQRETIGYHLADMDFRLRAEKIIEYIRNMENPVQVPETVKPIEVKQELKSIKKKELVQGELF
jgi:type I restriction-modification system DNA methylase subunit